MQTLLEISKELENEERKLVQMERQLEFIADLVRAKRALCASKAYELEMILDAITDNAPPASFPQLTGACIGALH